MVINSQILKWSIYWALHAVLEKNPHKLTWVEIEISVSVQWTARETFTASVPSATSRVPALTVSLIKISRQDLLAVEVASLAALPISGITGPQTITTALIQCLVLSLCNACHSHLSPAGVPLPTAASLTTAFSSLPHSFYPVFPQACPQHGHATSHLSEGPHHSLSLDFSSHTHAQALQAHRCCCSTDTQ